MAFRKAQKRFRKTNHERAQPANRRKFGMLEKHKVRGFHLFFFFFFPLPDRTRHTSFLVLILSLGLCEASPRLQ